MQSIRAMIVAVDGPAGTGKSSVCKCAAKQTRLFYVNSGNYYRAITKTALDYNISVNNVTELIKIMNTLSIEYNPHGFFLNQQLYDKELRTTEIDKNSPLYSSAPEIRLFVNTCIHKLAKEYNIIVEGRDMTTEVFPDASIKFYLDADVKVRAMRRFRQNGEIGKIEDIEARLIERDGMDAINGSLRKSQEAIFIDTTYLTLHEVCAKLVTTIYKAPEYLTITEGSQRQYES